MNLFQRRPIRFRPRSLELFGRNRLPFSLGSEITTGVTVGLIGTIMVGVILILMGATGLGRLIKYIPWPVTSGFTTGIAVAIMLTQAPDFVGLSGETAIPTEFLAKVPWLLENLAGLNPHALGLSILAVVVMLVWPKLKIPLLPGSIIAMLGATVLIAGLGWSELHGVATIGEKFGANAIPLSFPMPQFPAIEWNMVRDLIGPATVIALLGVVERIRHRGGFFILSGIHQQPLQMLRKAGFIDVVGLENFCPTFDGPCSGPGNF